MDKELIKIKNYFNDELLLQNELLEFLENDNDVDNYNNQIKLFDLINKKKFEENPDEFKNFLCLILNIANNHNRTPTFFTKIVQILQKLEKQIKQTFSNFETFKIFSSNKMILLFLFKKHIINPDETVMKEIIEEGKIDEIRKCHFFLPELKNIIPKDKYSQIEKEIINNKLTNFDDYEAKRLIGENDSHLCSLIRNDSVQEFIEYVNFNDISLSSKIKRSIFETNPFLIEKEATLIEYAAFFGSIQIIQYLRLNKVVMTPSLWIYGIHSNNAELIHILEDNHVVVEDGTFIDCLTESIKCHHNNMAKYIENNILIQKINDAEYQSNLNERIIASSFKYCNYCFFSSENDLNIEPNYLFFCMYKYNYSDIVKILLHQKRKEMKKRKI